MVIKEIVYKRKRNIEFISEGNLIIIDEFEMTEFIVNTFVPLVILNYS